MKIQIKKLHPDAKVPVFSLKGDAGMDLFSIEECLLKPGDKYIVKTGIAMKIPKGYAALVWDKGGPSHKFGIKTLGGVFDSNYTGEYLIGLVNLGKERFVIKKGQKIAQILIQKVETPKIEVVQELPRTNRGEGRHGSTGI
jgi:dUTP pyrophosphatase